jgi:hypothetical protein
MRTRLAQGPATIAAAVLAVTSARTPGRPARRRPPGRRWLRAGAVLAGLALASGSLPASAQTLTWAMVPSPNRGTGSLLNGVSCVSADACTAVGEASYTTRTYAQGTLAESWDGTGWSVVPSPSPGRAANVLVGVSCGSADACTAVGYSQNQRRYGRYRALAESWDGTRWSVTPSPDPAPNNYLLRVSCVSAAACMAVGYSSPKSDGAGYTTLIESWDGTTWSVLPSPNPSPVDYNILSGVSCVSATACTAVGYYQPSASTSAATLVESWDGTTWSVVPSPNPSQAFAAFLAGVSCVSAAACMAVGYYIYPSPSDPSVYLTGTLAESWDGTSWSVVPSPSPSVLADALSSVSCVSADACTAVGSYIDSSNSARKTLVESWDGTSWSVLPSPSPGTGRRGPTPELIGVSCISAATCTAAGYYTNTSHQRNTLIETGPITG